MVKTKKKQKYLHCKGFALMHEQYFNVMVKFARAKPCTTRFVQLYKLEGKRDYRK